MIVNLNYFFQEYKLVSEEEVSSNEHNQNHDKDVSTIPMLKDKSKQAEKPHICVECGTRFTRKGHLKRHLSIHTGDKPFSCQHCDYASAEKSNLTKHMRIHTGERPFSCSHCDYTCAQKGDLKKHIRTHRGEKSFS